MDYRENLIHDLQRLPKIKEELKTEENHAVRVWKERVVQDVERLLSNIDEDERLVVEQIIIAKRRGKDIAAETGKPIREIQQNKNAAIEHLLTLRHGAGYQP